MPKLKARHRRKVIGVLIGLWLGPGALVTYALKDSVPWLQVQSYLAILLSLAAWFGAETPVEEEET
jgi:hypothetical protein